MSQDIRKVADWIEKVTREGLAMERKARAQATAESPQKNRPAAPAKKTR
jgi:hypothetical protein